MRGIQRRDDETGPVPQHDGDAQSSTAHHRQSSFTQRLPGRRRLLPVHCAYIPFSCSSRRYKLRGGYGV